MDLGDFSVQLLAFLFFVGVVAGLLDTLAGGGGLIALPALIMSGVPPISALATNKLQGSMGTATATFLLIKNRRVNWLEIKPLMLFAFMGAVVGTIGVQFVNAKALAFIIPIVIFFIGLYFLLSPGPKEGSKPRASEKRYQNVVVPTIGCYDGFFGPGTGSFFALAGVSLRGQGLIHSTATAKTLNFATNIASLFVFIIAGQVMWLVGITMMLGQVIGAWLGTHVLFSINPKYLRVLVVVMCFAMLTKYVANML